MDPRARIGADAEQAAAQCLESAGAQILLRNYRRRSGELDIVARLDDTLIVAEVRCRSSQQFGGGAASVDRAKQRRIVRTTQQLLQQRPDLARLRVRFDVLALDGHSGVDWIRHAFEA